MWLQGFHLLAARLVETSIEEVVLAYHIVRHTVAGQRRTLTGFAFTPWHPGRGDHDWA